MFDELRELVVRDYEVFSGRALEAKVEAFFRKNPEKRDLAISLGALSLSDV